MDILANATDAEKAAILADEGLMAALKAELGDNYHEALTELLDVEDPSAALANAPDQIKADIISDTAFMDHLRGTLTLEEMREVANELVQVDYLPADGAVREQTVELILSDREIDRNTAMQLVTGNIRVYYIEELVPYPGDESGSVYYDPPDQNEPLIIPEGTRGLTFGGHNEVYIARDQSDDEIRQTIVHEVNHAVNDPAMPTTPSLFESEFRAFWVDEKFGNLPPAERAEAVKNRIFAAYDDLKAAYDSDPAIQSAIDDYIKEVVEEGAPDGNLDNR